MAKNEDITTRFKADIKDFKKGIEEAKKEITLANSEFKAASNGTDSWAKSVDGLSSKITQIKSVLDAQNKKLDAYKEELKVASKYEEEAKQKVEQLKKALADAKSEYGENSKEVKQLKSELVKAEKEENKMANQVHQFTVDMNNQQGTVNRTTAELDRYTDELEQVKSQSSKAYQDGMKLEKAFNVIGDAAINLAQEAVSALINKLKELAIESINVGKEFDYAMSEVKAISGSTGKEYDALRKKAKEMGASTKFTATESANAFKYMAMAGWDSNKMLKGIEGVMRLASASGEDLATTSDIVTDSLTAFGMKADECNRFVDVLAKTATSSNTDVAKMGETFKYVAPVAGQFGYKVEDVAVGIGLMANAGIKSATAGTTLRSVFTRLATNAGATSKSIGALDVLTEKLGVQFYNADHSMRPLGEVLAELRPKWQQLNKEEQANYANKIAGKQALSGFNAMLNASDEDFNKLTKDINNSDGAAKKMSETMEDNLQGDLNKANSTLESLQLTLYEKVSPAFRDATQKVTQFGQDLSKALNSNESGSTIKFLNKILGDAIKNFNPLTLINQVSNKVSEFMANLFVSADTQQAALEFSKLIGKLMLAGFLLVTTAPITLLVDGLILGIFKTIGAKIGEILTTTWTTVSTFFTSLPEKIGVFFTNIWTTVSTFFTSIPGKISTFFTTVWNAITTFFTSLPEKIGTFLSNVWNAITTFLSSLPSKIGFALEFVIGTITKFFLKMVNLAVTQVPKFISSIINFIRTLPSKMWSFLLSAINFVVSFTAKLISKGMEAGSKFISSIINFFKTLPSKIWNFLNNTIDKVKNFVSNLKDKAKEAGNKFKDNLVDTVKKIPDKMAEIGKNIVEGIWNGIKGAKDWLIGKAGEFKDSVVDGFKSAFKINSPAKVMYTIGRSISEGVAVGITKETKTANNAIKSMVKGTISTAKSTLQSSGFENVTKNIASKFSSTISNYVKTSNTGIKNIINTQISNYNKMISKSSKSQKKRLKTQRDNLKTASKSITKVYSNVLTKFQKDANNLVSNTMTNLSKKYEEKYTKIAESYKSMKDKLLGYGDVFTQSGDFVVLNDLKAQTKEMTNYVNTLKKLKGKVSSSLFDYVASLDVNIGKNITEKLLSMDSKELKEYDAAYKNKISTATKLTDSLYKNDITKLNQEFNKAVDNSLRDINKKLEKMGKNSINGFVNGMKTQTKGLGKDVKSIANSIVKQFKKALKIKSPSKTFADEIGKFIPSGIAYGMKNNVDTLYKDVRDLSKGIVNASSSMLGNLSNNLNAGANTDAISSNQTLNFYQTNNSPEPLSRMEIYNQTRNQLNFARMVMNNA